MPLALARYGGLESPIARNFSVNYPSLPAWLVQFGRGTNLFWDTGSNIGSIGIPCMICIVNRACLISLQFIDAAALMIGMFIHGWPSSWPSFIFMLRTHTYLSSSTSFCTALLLPALPKVHSDAEGGPLNLPQSLVIMLALRTSSSSSCNNAQQP